MNPRILAVSVFCVFSVVNSALAQMKPAPQADRDKLTADLAGADRHPRQENQGWNTRCAGSDGRTKRES